MTLVKIPQTFTTQQGKTYYVDNYILNQNRRNKWRIVLFNKEIITEEHPDFPEFVKCFDWLTYKVTDVDDFDDRAEQREERFFNLSEFASTFDFSTQERAELDEALYMAEEKPGYYTGFPDDDD